MTKTMHLYVVHFSNDLIKVGVSADVKKRMTYYRQEARRHSIDHVVWWASAPFDTKANALLGERVLSRAYAEHAIPSHREWFRGNSDGFKGVLATAEKIRELIGYESDVEKVDLPYMGSYGSYFGLAGAA